MKFLCDEKAPPFTTLDYFRGVVCPRRMLVRVSPLHPRFPKDLEQEQSLGLWMKKRRACTNRRGKIVGGNGEKEMMWHDKRYRRRGNERLKNLYQIFPFSFMENRYL